MTQKTRILDYIALNGYITSKKAYDELGVTQLGARIFELEHNDGYTFERKRVRVINRFGEPCDVIRYSLAVD